MEINQLFSFLSVRNIFQVTNSCNNIFYNNFFVNVKGEI